MADIDVSSIKKTFSNLTTWMKSTNVAYILREWKQADSATFSRMDGFLDPDSSVSKPVSDEQLIRELRESNKKSYDKIADKLNPLIQDNLRISNIHYLHDQTGFINTVVKYLKKNPNTLDRGNLKGYLIKSLLINWYFYMLAKMMESYAKMIGDYGYRNQGFEVLFSMDEIRNRVANLIKRMRIIVKDEAKFEKYVSSFSEAELSKIFLSMNMIVRDME